MSKSTKDKTKTKVVKTSSTKTTKTTKAKVSRSRKDKAGKSSGGAVASSAAETALTTVPDSGTQASTTIRFQHLVEEAEDLSFTATKNLALYHWNLGRLARKVRADQLGEPIDGKASARGTVYGNRTIEHFGEAIGRTSNQIYRDMKLFEAWPDKAQIERLVDRGIRATNLLDMSPLEPGTQESLVRSWVEAADKKGLAKADPRELTKMIQEARGKTKQKKKSGKTATPTFSYRRMIKAGSKLKDDLPGMREAFSYFGSLPEAQRNKLSADRRDAIEAIKTMHALLDELLTEIGAK